MLLGLFKKLWVCSAKHDDEGIQGMYLGRKGADLISFGKLLYNVVRRKRAVAIQLTELTRSAADQ